MPRSMMPSSRFQPFTETHSIWEFFHGTSNLDGSYVQARRHRLEARRIDMPVSAQRRAFCTSMANKSLTAATEVLMRFGEERREGATPEQYILLAECTFLQGDWKVRSTAGRQSTKLAYTHAPCHHLHHRVQ